MECPSAIKSQKKDFGYTEVLKIFYSPLISGFRNADGAYY